MTRRMDVTSGVLIAVAALLGGVACGGSDDESGGFGSDDADNSGETGSPGDGAALGGGGADSFGGTGGGSSTGTGGSTAGDFGGSDPNAGFGGAAGGPAAPPGNTNVSLGGSQDFGYFRALLDANQVPNIGDFDAAGFFAEHHTELPAANCGTRVCLQAMLGVMGNLMNGANCTMLQLGLNSPIAADPGSRPPLSLSVVVDTSGSMNTEGKIDFVRQGLGLLIDGLRDGDRFSLITYDTDVEVPFPMADVVGNRVQLRALVDGLVAGGSTNLYAGLEAGYHESIGAYDSGRQNRVILLSDGEPTAGITSTPSILQMSEGYNSDGVGLTTVGLGTSFNIELMRDLALQADGNFYFLENAGAVSEVFDEELSYFTVPIAFDLKLDVHTGTQYNFGVARGTPFWEDTAFGGSLEVPSVFIAHRESADDVTNSGGRRGGGSALLIEMMPKLTADDGSGITNADIAQIDIQFREPGTNAIIQDSIVVNYPSPPWVTPSTGYFMANDVAVVQKSFVMLNIYVGIENAVRAYHEDDDPTGAVAQLEALLAAVRDYNEEVQDTDMDFNIALLEQLRDVMFANGVQPPVNPPIPANPWPAD